MSQQTSPLDNFEALIKSLLQKGNGPQAIADYLNVMEGCKTTEASVRRAIKRLSLEEFYQPTGTASKAEPVGVTYDNATNSATITEGVMNQDELSDLQLGDLERLMRNRGLDPEQWIIERVTVNEWEANAGRAWPGKDDSEPAAEPDIITLKQLKIQLKRKFALKFVSPAVHVPPLAPRSGLLEPFADETLAVIVGDEQEPYSDPKLKQLFLEWLEYNEPNRGVHLGDLMDFPTISRHKDNPEWAASAQDCINAGYNTLRSYVEASPDTKWQLLIGNHDERLRTELLLRAERMYGIKPADNGEEQEDALSIRRLLHLDTLGIEFIAPKGGYAHAHTKLSDLLGVRHGWLTGANTAARTLERLGHSVIVGHTHSQAVSYKTTWGIDGAPNVLTAVEAGTMCQVDDGLGYTINPDWQQGFATATIWPDGTFNIDLATYANGVLRWRDQRFE